MAYKDTFTKSDSNPKLDKDREELEQLLIDRIYSDNYELMYKIIEIVKRHGKGAIKEPWDAETTQTMASIYDEVRTLIVNMDSRHGDSEHELYIPTVAELPS